MTELGLSCDTSAITAFYDRLIDGMLVETGGPPGGPNLPISRTESLLVTIEDRLYVARATLEFVDRPSASSEELYHVENVAKTVGGAQAVRCIRAPSTEDD